MHERTKNRCWGIAALLAGLTGLGYSARIIVLAAGQDEWKPVQALVVQSHTTKRQKGSGFTTHFSAHFAYRYEVEGEVYTEDRYSYFSVGGDKWRGTQIYQPGDQVEIFHHPDRPGIAVVERVRPSMFVWLVVVFGLVFAWRGAVMIKTGTSAG